MSVIRAQVADDFTFMTGGIHFRIALCDVDQRGYPVRTIQRLHRTPTMNPIWQPISDEERQGLMPSASDDTAIWHLPEGCGEALTDALVRHFRGIAPDAAMAALLSHEQERRDKLEEALIRIAQGAHHGDVQLQEGRKQR